MKARAPGKLVLSGAYAVLEGATAIVAAVDRHALADGGRPADFVTAEVGQAVARGHLAAAPWFDASALREPLADGGSRKLGLGSSAAILVASLATQCREEPLGQAIFGPALRCHRAAQAGGSGIDVAAACFGGVLACTMMPDESLQVAPIELPL